MTEWQVQLGQRELRDKVLLDPPGLVEQTGQLGQPDLQVQKETRVLQVYRELLDPLAQQAT